MLINSIEWHSLIVIYKNKGFNIVNKGITKRERVNYVRKYHK